MIRIVLFLVHLARQGISFWFIFTKSEIGKILPLKSGCWCCCDDRSADWAGYWQNDLVERVARTYRCCAKDLLGMTSSYGYKILNSFMAIPKRIDKNQRGKLTIRAACRKGIVWVHLLNTFENGRFSWNSLNGAGIENQCLVGNFANH